MDIFPVMAIMGPRQCGKTTLARSIAANDPSHDPALNYFDLESPVSLARLEEPWTALSGLKSLVVIDEIQRRPDLFPVLRVLVDRPEAPANFLILGSASTELIRQSSESLTGRIGHLELTPFAMREYGPALMRTSWLRGGYPRSFLAKTDNASWLWREAYLRTYLEQDVREFGIGASVGVVRRLWQTIGYRHAQVVNLSEMARDLQVSSQTVRRYLDILAGTFAVRLLPPWFENAGKRLVKSPKLYIRDSGLLHAVTGVRHLSELEGSFGVGPSWEGFAMEECLRATSAAPYFWTTHNAAEIDLVLVSGRSRLGVEFKFTDAPKRTRSMLTALDELHLEGILVVYPGEAAYSLGDRIQVVSLPEAVRRLSMF